MNKNQRAVDVYPRGLTILVGGWRSAPQRVPMGAMTNDENLIQDHQPFIYVPGDGLTDMFDDAD